jgi:hypothetical protein
MDEEPSNNRDLTGKFARGNKVGRGRPAGSRNQATVVLQELLDGAGKGLTARCIKMAHDGDPTALRLVMERLIPPRKDRPVSLRLPKINTAAEVSKATAAVLRAVASGEITPSEGEIVSSIIEMRRRAIETAEFESRLAALEEKQIDGRRNAA